MNFYVLAIFAPILILVGVLGFVILADKSLTSCTPAYNIFHILFGVLGLVVLFFCDETGWRAFNIGFGIIDLYQAAASFLGLAPKGLFRWTRTDDVLHVVIGALLVAIGALA